jgi:hypothetical protein
VENTVPVQPAAAPADLAAFLARERRLPRLGDAPAPWRYRGWLLPYVILLHGLYPAVADRWGYYLRTLEAGHLLDAPIPRSPSARPTRRSSPCCTTGRG